MLNINDWWHISIKFMYVTFDVLPGWCRQRRRKSWRLRQKQVHRVELVLPMQRLEPRGHRQLALPYPIVDRTRSSWGCWSRQPEGAMILPVPRGSSGWRYQSQDSCSRGNRGKKDVKTFKIRLKTYNCRQQSTSLNDPVTKLDGPEK